MLSEGRSGLRRTDEPRAKPKPDDTTEGGHECRDVERELLSNVRVEKSMQAIRNTRHVRLFPFTKPMQNVEDVRLARLQAPMIAVLPRFRLLRSGSANFVLARRSAREARTHLVVVLLIGEIDCQLTAEQLHVKLVRLPYNDRHIEKGFLTAAGSRLLREECDA